MLAKILLSVFLILGTLCAVAIATSLWTLAIKDGADAVDIALLLRSPFYWLMVAAILFVGGWLVKRWVFA